MKLYRQGDVLFQEVSAIPPGVRKPRKDGVIVEGEVTGHAHRLATQEGCALFEVGQGLHLSVSAEGGISIVHEEHKTIVLPPGEYEVRRQREYSPERIRNVAD